MSNDPTTFSPLLPGSRLDAVLRVHRQRATLANELHARPPLTLAAPARVTMLAMFLGDGGAEAERAHLERLCDHVQAQRPSTDALQYNGMIGTIVLRWERHTEFSTWTFVRSGAFPDPLTEPFSETALDEVPREWLAGLPGELVAATHLAVLPATMPEPARDRLLAFFGPDGYMGSGVAGGAATVWTDLRVHGDGFSRLLVLDRGLRGHQAGRMVQRLLDIEHYRVLALMALPIAREIQPSLARMEQELVMLTDLTTRELSLSEERDVLDRLTRLAAEIERMIAETSSRFAACRAQHGLVERRIEELREVRIEGLQTFHEFLTRRLAPAARTCNAVEDHLAALSERVARASNLLRTRVELVVEGQNAALLQSMDRRAHMQLRLQETVEGLSVVAISYYLLNLTGDAAKGAKAIGLNIEPDVAVGIAVPIVLVLVWAAIRRIRRALTDRL